jgi:hypothetical protein
MKLHASRYYLLYVLTLVLFVQLACILGGNATDTTEEGPDLAATEAALQETQAALEEQANQPGPTPEPLPTDTSPPPPTNAPTEEPTEEPVVEPSSTPEDLIFISGDVIYFTDFEGSGDWEDGWSHFSIPEMDYTVYKANGYMHVEVPDQYSAVYLIYDDLYFELDNADVFVEAKFQNMDSQKIKIISLVCRVSDQGWYEFSMLSGGLWYIWKYFLSTDDYVLIEEGEIPNPNYDSPHTIGAECLGDQLDFYFDGESLHDGTITDTQFREGQTGISVYADDWANVIVEFDYFGIAVP